MPPVMDPSAAPRLAIAGRIVTMDDRDAVLAHGVVYIAEGAIVDVRDRAAPAPAGFEDCPVLQTCGTVYPGLIELHNHLSYNALPLWNVPETFSYHEQWKDLASYKRTITKPMQVLGRSPGLPAAIVRYVECKCLMAGVTTSQGITLQSNAGIQRMYRGLVRNVEETGDPALPDATARVAAAKPGEAAAFAARVARAKGCYLHHLSEGLPTHARAHQELLRLQIDPERWAISDRYAGIHALGLWPEDFQRLAALGAAVIWSPMSNLVLYGQTIDLRALAASGVLIGVGSDWSPSGSKNLLGELKVAHLVSQHQDERGPVFSPRDIVAMATRNAARILAWESQLGSLAPGKRADLLVVTGQRGDPYQHLLESRETSIALVMLDGVARYGQRRWMERLVPAAELEPVTVGSVQRALYLRQPTADPIVAGLSLDAARQALADAMARLPELARDLAQPPAGFVGGSLDDEGNLWSLDLELDTFDPHGDDSIQLALSEQGFEAAMPMADTPALADFVAPMRLDPLTVAGDPAFFRTLAALRNVPDYVKQCLPPLYSKKPVPAGEVAFQDGCPPATRAQLGQVVDLRTFLGTRGTLGLAERRRIVEQAILVLEDHYVHLPLKKAMHGVDPVQRLKLLRYRLEALDEARLPPELDFHEEMLDIFGSLRDLHTSYLLPAPYRDQVAFLPFLIEECFDAGEPRCLVTKLLGAVRAPSFVPGVEILSWSGVPIQQEIARNAERQAGGNRAARHARGLAALTIRPLASSPPPAEEWVLIGYRTLDGAYAELRQRWLVAPIGRGPAGIDADALDRAEAVDAGALALALDHQADAVQEVKKVLFAAPSARAEQGVARDGRARKSAADALPTTFPGVLRARIVDSEHGPLGYLRIFTFNVHDPDGFVQEVARLLEQLPQAGLILDVRGNGGGLIYAAERLLQLFTPHPIEPERAELINTPANLALCRAHAPSPLDPALDLGPWHRSIRQSVVTGATYSHAWWITSPASCNRIGQRYYGPVVLITDALCYSATDMFCAGFQDHGIGPILGTSASTGAGGANVWSHRQLGLLRGAGGADGHAGHHVYAPLPAGAGMRVAVRRTLRVGREAGTVLEDLGVEADQVHLMTPHDLLDGNRDLIRAAAGLLAGHASHAMRMELRRGARERLILAVHTENIDRVDLYIDQVPRGSCVPRQGVAELTVAEDLLRREASVEIRGWQDNRPVALRREQLTAPGNAARPARKTRAPAAGAISPP